MAIFVLSGTDLQAQWTIDGPVAPATVRSGKDLYKHILLYDKNSQHQHSQHSEIIHQTGNVNFEHYNLLESADLEAYEEEDQEQYEQETPEQRKERKNKQRKQLLEIRKKIEDSKYEQHKHVKSNADPHLTTIQATAQGWYRFCLKATHADIVAEIEIRKESDAGGIDSEGHVLSMEEAELQQEDKLLREAVNTNSSGVRNEDFDVARDKLRTLRRLLADIQTKQQHERHRLILHSATNEHSHSRMVLGSLLETLMFMAVTGYQVWTIRRWFQAAPVLGR